MGLQIEADTTSRETKNNLHLQFDDNVKDGDDEIHRPPGITTPVPDDDGGDVLGVDETEKETPSTKTVRNNDELNPADMGDDK